jgi:alpha-ribazole phosphatase
MPVTNFWLIRHALVEENARAYLYGTMDVEICPATLVAQAPVYQALAARLPRTPAWYCTPLGRTRRTAEAIQHAGYGAVPLTVEPALIEQEMGEWQGLGYGALPERLTIPKHNFWPFGALEKPPGGESMDEVITRVGGGLDRLVDAHPDQDVVIVSHGGAIRAAVAHALHIDAENALHLSVQNLSLTRLERHSHAWKVVCVNEMAGY